MIEELLDTEYPRIIRLCAYLTGESTEAADLAQETLIEAWRNRHKLVDPVGAKYWLSAIARFVCLRWARKRGRELAVHVEEDENAVEQIADTLNIEVELERNDLITLLDRALAMLPPDTRDALIARYVDESPLAEIAGQLGLNEGTLAVRVHRGKLALEKVLQTHLRDEVEPYGLFTTGAWQSTSMWCFVCGEHKVSGMLNPSAGIFKVRCPGCYQRTGQLLNNTENLPQILRGVQGFKTAINRLLKWMDSYYITSLHSGGQVRCSRCNRPNEPKLLRRDDGIYYIDGTCKTCGGSNTQGLWGLAMALPEANQFTRDALRFRALPQRLIDEVDGHPAVEITHESLVNSRQFSVIMARDTGRFLRVQVL